MASPIITIVTPGDLSDDEDEPVPIQDFPLDKVFHTVADYMHEIPLCTIFHEIACCNPARGANVTFQVHPPKGPVFKGVYLGFTLGETSAVYWVISLTQDHERTLRTSTRTRRSTQRGNPMSLLWAISRATWKNLGQGMADKQKALKNLGEDIVIMPAWFCSKVEAID